MYINDGELVKVQEYKKVPERYGWNERTKTDDNMKSRFNAQGTTASNVGKGHQAR